MKNSIQLLFVFLFVCLGCNRTDKSPVTGNAGKGGNAVLKITPQHHGSEIDSCTIYIKYNSQDATSTYDDSVVCVQENGKPVATFIQLKTGSYYLLGKGWDPGIVQNVRGGLPYIINEEKAIEIVLPVTESH